MEKLRCIQRFKTHIQRLEDILSFLYHRQVFWGLDTQLLSQPDLEGQATSGAPISRDLGLQVCFISLAPTGHPTFSSSILNGPQ